MKKLFVCLVCCVVAVTFSSCGRKSYVNVGGLKWAAKNVGATEDNPYGDLYTYDQALKACPDGWRLPTSDELGRLCLQYSKPVSYDGMNGVWLSGSTPYKDGVDAVFLPMAGCSEGYGKEDVDSGGFYWSSTAVDDEVARGLGVRDVFGRPVCMGDGIRSVSFSVRCVKK